MKDVSGKRSLSYNSNLNSIVKPLSSFVKRAPALVFMNGQLGLQIRCAFTKNYVFVFLSLLFTHDGETAASGFGGVPCTITTPHTTRNPFQSPAIAVILPHVVSMSLKLALSSLLPVPQTGSPQTSSSHSCPMFPAITSRNFSDFRISTRSWLFLQMQQYLVF